MQETRDMGSILESGKSCGKGHSNPFQYSCLENPMDWGAWQASESIGSQKSDTTKAIYYTHTTFSKPGSKGQLWGFLRLVIGEIGFQIFPLWTNLYITTYTHTHTPQLQPSLVKRNGPQRFHNHKEEFDKLCPWAFWWSDFLFSWKRNNFFRVLTQKHGDHYQSIEYFGQQLAPMAWG